MIKTYLSLPLTRLLLLPGLLLSISPAFALTVAEADRIVAEEAGAENTANTEKKNRLHEIPAIRETVLHLSEGKVTVREVAPPAVPPLPAQTKEEIVTLSQALTFEARAEKSITLLIATTGEWSEIRATGEEGSVVVPIGLRHLPAFLTLETPEKRLHFFSILQILENPNPSADDISLSTATRESIDLLLRHYEENQTRYETQAHEAARLQAARARYSEENSRPKETTLNIWRYRHDDTQ